MKKTTDNLSKLINLIFQLGLSDEDIIVADGSKHEAKLHLEPSAFRRVTGSLDVTSVSFGGNIHKHCKINGITVLSVFRCKLVEDE
jgi:hypothetical protein